MTGLDFFDIQLPGETPTNVPSSDTPGATPPAPPPPVLSGPPEPAQSPAPQTRNRSSWPATTNQWEPKSPSRPTQPHPPRLPAKSRADTPRHSVPALLIVGGIFIVLALLWYLAISPSTPSSPSTPPNSQRVTQPTTAGQVRSIPPTVAIPTPTSVPLITPTLIPLATANTTLMAWVYAQPNTDSPALGSIPAQATIGVSRRLPSGLWCEVYFGDNQSGWVYCALLDISGGLDVVPLAD